MVDVGWVRYGSMLLARACKEVLESNPDAKGWRIASAVRLDDAENGN